MRAIKLAAAALVLSGISVPVHAQVTTVFDNWGSCNSYLGKAIRAASRGGNAAEAARWNAAYCDDIAYKQFVIVFPF